MSAEFVPSQMVENPARIEALESYGILDTQPEQGFDDVVLLAAQICATPTALVSLVARDRQWFKARIGFEICETPLDQSVCAHALGRTDVLVIPDLTRDSRTCANRLVTGEPHLRFYAGAPLQTPQGVTLGTLCVIDTVARPQGLTEIQLGGLTALARQVMVQLELHRAIENRGQALAARAKAEEQLRLAAEATGIGVFDFDPNSGDLRWDARVRALFGVPERSSVTYEGTFLANVHPADRAHADAAVRAALDPAGLRMFDTAYRVLAADTGAERWIAARGQAIVEAGVTIRFVGTVRDITEQKQAELALQSTEERYRLAARATTDAIWDWDLTTNHVHWNEAMATAYGHEPGTIEPSGEWWLGHIHPEDRAAVDSSIHAVIEGRGTAWTGQYRFLRADGSYAPVLDRGYVLRDDHGQAVRMIGAMLDLTEIRAAEAALVESQRQLGLERGLLRAVFQQAPVGISIADASSNWTTMINAQAEELLGYGLGAPDDGGGAVRRDGRPYAALDYPTLRALHQGETVRGEEMRYRNARTSAVRRFEVSSAPVRDETGSVQAAVTVLVDVEDRLRAQDEARKLAAIVEQSTDFIGIALPDGSVDFVNEAGRRMVGQPDLAAARATKVIDYFVPAEHVRITGEVLPTVVRDGFWEGELTFRNFATGAHIPVLYNIFPVRGDDGQLLGYGTVTRDLTEAKRAEAAQALLNHEIGHRMKNLLAMVQSLASQTLRGATSLEAAQQILGARLVALGRAQDVLLGGSAVRAPIEAVVRGGIGVHDDGGGRVHYGGPEVEVSRGAALSLSLMVHELATNAVKYGALSVPDGRVSVTWALENAEDADAGPNLCLTWAESGGPPVTPPARRGFGSRLIERGMSAQVGGTVSVDYGRDGVSCVVQAPLANFQTGQ